MFVHTISTKSAFHPKVCASVMSPALTYGIAIPPYDPFLLFPQAETELAKAQNDASIGSQALAKQMREFEKEKLHDLKVNIVITILF